MKTIILFYLFFNLSIYSSPPDIEKKFENLLQNHLVKLRQEFKKDIRIFFERKEDLNKDGRVDIIATLYLGKFEEKNFIEDIDEWRYLAIAVGTENNELELIYFNNEFGPENSGGIFGLYPIVNFENEILTIGEEYGSNWRNYNFEKLKISGNILEKLESISQTWYVYGENTLHYESSFDYLKMEGHKYKISEDKPTVDVFYKSLLTISNEIISLDGKIRKREWSKMLKSKINENKYLIKGKKNWNGMKDLSFSLKSAFYNNQLFIASKIYDDKIRFISKDQKCDEVKNYDSLNIFLQKRKDDYNAIQDLPKYDIKIYPVENSDTVLICGNYANAFNNLVKAVYRKSKFGCNIEILIKSNLFSLDSFSNYENISFIFDVIDFDMNLKNKNKKKIISTCSSVEKKVEYCGKLEFRESLNRFFRYN